MYKMFAIALLLASCVVLPGCDFFPDPTPGQPSTPVYHAYLIEYYVNASGIFKPDPQDGPTYYTSGGFTKNGVQTTGGSLQQALGGGGTFYANLNTAPTQNSPVVFSWAVSHANDIIYCPSKINGGFSNPYVYTDNVIYRADGENKGYECNTASPAPLGIIDPNNPVASVSMTMSAPVDITYGTPMLQYFDAGGNYLGTESSFGLAADGSIVVPTDQLMAFAPGDVVVNAYSINSDGSWNPLGGGITTILPLYNPGPDPGPGPDPNPPGCYSNNCIALPSPN